MSECEDPKPEPVEEKDSDDCKKECNTETNDSAEDPCDPDFGGGVSYFYILRSMSIVLLEEFGISFLE